MCRSRSTKAIGVLFGSLGLFWTEACVGARLESFLLYLFIYALILYLLNRKAFYFCVLNSVVKEIKCLLSRGVPPGL
jgi:hypothetical protein